MIITCPNCNKQFKIDYSLIPDEGRDLQCGSCNHIWFYNIQEKNSEKQKKTTTLKKTESKGSKFFSYLMVFIISFVALIILLDTLKTPIINVFPGLEIILFNLFETLKDIKLFIIDLI